MDDPAGGQWERILAAVIEDSHLIPAERLTETVDRAVRPVGLGVQVLMVDLAQRTLQPLLTGDAAAPIPVEGTVGGRAYQFTEIVAGSDGAGDRVLWLPLLDGTERVGVLRVALAPGVVDDAVLHGRLWALAGLVGHVLMTKIGQNTWLQRFRAPRLAPEAELLWRLLPPRTLATEQVVISALLEPVDEVAGDAYDYAVGDTIDLAIFDGVGHDIMAGVSTALALTAVRNARREGVTDLAAQAERADAVLEEHDGPGRFVTAALARLDVTTGELTYLLAGHPAPFLLRDGQMIKELGQPPRLPLGVTVPGAATADVVGHEQLEPGDRVLFYTDGVTEARDENGRFFGEQRLIDMAERAELDHLSAPETLRRLVAAVLAHQNDRLQDDATLLMLDWASDRHPRLFPSIHGAG
ncbi:PP2C family protein-serine/threonine phosphatase [Pseudonocardia parietis]|uniref:PPM-type phosphatase domain-containing protein n=1 Tax=Pseudonocardia parietis TaxID=570936 RepID=A0ABS4VT82_9PSEU|nr:PP2C family protein-serine/threonine phosphatase [Pseudonocardia parietis]MBP2367114.1 hypothetical protein [Pseudonocardia parietis]